MKKEVYLDPLYKWTGGKRKEIKTFNKFYPEFVKDGSDYKFVEPFFGGGAVYWSLNAKENVINDIDSELINFIKHAKTNSNEIIESIGDRGLKFDWATNTWNTSEEDQTNKKIAELQQMIKGLTTSQLNVIADQTNTDSQEPTPAQGSQATQAAQPQSAQPSEPSSEQPTQPVQDSQATQPVGSQSGVSSLSDMAGILNNPDMAKKGDK